jgi:hypothetical protein
MVSGLSYGASCPSISMQERMYTRKCREEADKLKISVIDGNNKLRLTQEEIQEYISNGLITELGGVYYAI